ncbi:hypothetical protein LCR01_07040 [Companilactobacillus crustorum]|uniref:S-layer protein C-terminal domain-containing protein n=3 Tax=Companilactobacillus TaxID=2767879 RepID=A0A837RI14_9LACO|nr:SLAP domain-containing protein [Companilactobacillus crustorum]KRK43052.1 hypothetical protein FD26_GL000244 [Companilactobacillus crustorum JCM 15951]KRO20696.1 hypothetical protein IV63_GL000275 [Companilactobacillus crustorum]GEO76261.1 hypothetical protein LCR01_07040 [Companilactobacillus crustorum]
MKKSILFLVCALLGTGSTFTTAASSITDVNAQSVSSGNFAQVDVDQAQVYDQNGSKVDVALQNNSTWKVAKTQSINGTNYYQVAPNQFLSSKDSFSYKNRRMTIKVQSLDGADKNVNVYDHNLVQRTDVSIAPNSQWATDTVINTSNGMPFLRIAPDEYVAMYDVVEQSFKATI